MSAQELVTHLASKGFTFGQLLQLYKRWMQEGRITHETKTFEVVRDIVIPETSRRCCCFMDIVVEGPVQPRKLVSHYWGNRFRDLVRCIAEDASGLSGDELEQHVFRKDVISEEALGKMYWLCIFAVNQHVSICGSKRNPCNCRTQKFASGHPLCQVDNFPQVMSIMPDGLVVALDSDLLTLT